MLSLEWLVRSVGRDMRLMGTPRMTLINMKGQSTVPMKILTPQSKTSHHSRSPSRQVRRTPPPQWSGEQVCQTMRGRNYTGWFIFLAGCRQEVYFPRLRLHLGHHRKNLDSRGQGHKGSQRTQATQAGRSNSQEWNYTDRTHSLQGQASEDHRCR